MLSVWRTTHTRSRSDNADTMGLLVMDEFIDEWREINKWIIQRSMSEFPDSLKLGYSKYFDERVRRISSTENVDTTTHHYYVSIGTRSSGHTPTTGQLDRKGYVGLALRVTPRLIVRILRRF